MSGLLRSSSEFQSFHDHEQELRARNDWRTVFSNSALAACIRAQPLAFLASLRPACFTLLAGRPRIRGGAAALSMEAVGKTLVLGATGKVGGMVVRQLAAEGTPVLALARCVREHG